MTKVPQIKKFEPSKGSSTAIYCFSSGISEADKKHDIAMVDEFIKYIKAKKRKKEQS